MKFKSFLFAAVAVTLFVSGTHAADVILWEDMAPVGGDMLLTATTETAVTGGDTGFGDIGAFDSSLGAQFQNYNSGLQDWSAYAGEDWTFSVDVYITAAQLADTTINDDNIFRSINGSGGNFTNIGTAGWTGDAWNTVTWTGTFDSDPSSLTASNFLFLNNDQATQPVSGPNYYLDNFRLVANLPDPPAAVFDFTNPDYSNGGLSGQQGWNTAAGWNVADAAGTGNANTPNGGEIATYGAPITLSEGESFSYAVDFEFSGTYATPEDFTYSFLSGLTDSNSTDAIAIGSEVAADANLQFLASTSGEPPVASGNADKYRLLSNFKTIAGAGNVGGSAADGGDDTQLNEGDQLRFEYEITLGADAASTTYTVKLDNLTDGTSTGKGTVDNYAAGGASDPATAGVHPDLYAALTGDGAYVFFQSVNLDGAGFDGLTVHSIEGDLPEFTGTPGDIDGDGDVDGADFLAYQRTNPSGIPTWRTNYPSPLGAVTAVPEPSTFMLLGIGSLGLLRRRARS